MCKKGSSPLGLFITSKKWILVKSWGFSFQSYSDTPYSEDCLVYMDLLVLDHNGQIRGILQVEPFTSSFHNCVPTTDNSPRHWISVQCTWPVHNSHPILKISDNKQSEIRFGGHVRPAILSLMTLMVLQEQAGDAKHKKTSSSDPNLVSMGTNTLCPLHIPHMYTLPLSEAAADMWLLWLAATATILTEKEEHTNIKPTHVATCI